MTGPFESTILSLMTTISGTLEWPATRRSTAGTWLISRAGDFWLACAGGGVLLVAMVIVLQWHGDRELDTADLLLSELHLGATYDAIVRGRIWRRMPFDVIAVPLVIIALTYALMFGGHGIVVTTAALYLGAWHRGRQNFGVARYYQSRMGGPLSQWHRRLFASAIYAPMIEVCSSSRAHRPFTRVKSTPAWSSIPTCCTSLELRRLHASSAI